MESDRMLGVAILGLGRWGVNLLRNFLAHPQVRVVAIADPQADRLQAVAQQFCLSPQVIQLKDWQQALAISGIEAVAVATPASTHVTLIRAALERQYHVLAEKPLSLNATEAVALCRLAAQQQRQLVVDHTYLFHPAVRRGQQTVHELGHLRYGYATRTHLGPIRTDVDALWDLMIHDLTIFNDWLGATPCALQAQGTVWLQPEGRGQGAGALASNAQGLSDLVWVKLLYPSGFQASIHLCWANADKQRRLSVVGDRGTLVFDELAAHPLTLQQGHLEHSAQSVAPSWTPIPGQQQILDVEPLEPLWQLCDHFVHCARHNRPSDICSGWMGVHLVRLLEGLTRSLHQNGAIVQVEPSSFESNVEHL